VASRVKVPSWVQVLVVVVHEVVVVVHFDEDEHEAQEEEDSEPCVVAYVAYVAWKGGVAVLVSGDVLG